MCPAAAKAVPSAESPPPITGQDARRSFEFLHVGELLAKRTPLAWAIRNVLTQNSLNAVVGAPASGKSFLTIDWAGHKYSGLPWNGNATTRGAIICWLARVHRTSLAALLQIKHGASLRDAPLYISKCAALLDQAPDVMAVMESVDAIMKAIEPGDVTIIIDTLARSYSGEENSATDMKRGSSRAWTH